MAAENRSQKLGSSNEKSKPGNVNKIEIFTAKQHGYISSYAA
jgi:hypothetical protein